MKKHLMILAAMAAMAFTAVGAQTTTNNITLAWTQPDNTITEFRMYEQISGAWTLVKTVPSVQGVLPRTVMLTGVTTGVHTYRVTAFSAGGESLPSNTVTTSPLPNAPTGLTITVVVTVTTP